MNIPKKIFLIPIALTLAACGVNKYNSVALSPSQKPAKAVVNFQTRKAYAFNQGKIVFNNQFAGARLDSVYQQNDSTFTVLIKSENKPINPSPWYAFKVWSKQPKNVYINLTYQDVKHRYAAKISTDGKTWTSINNFTVSKDRQFASLSFKASSTTAIIAGQEISTSADTYKWEDNLAKLPYVKKQLIGKSILGRNINAINTTQSDGKKIILVISRQHPPEVTGFMAMQSFVRTVLGDTELAKNFRKNYELVVVPTINPDGVDEGHWRHSTAGVDLNRDWQGFAQPEVIAVRDFVLKKIKEQNAKVYFGIDFHSTFYDVFYTNKDHEGYVSNSPQLSVKWLDEMVKTIPNFKPRIEPSPNGNNVSKSWMSRDLKAEALTYEVGDNTPRNELKTKGEIAAVKLMELLLKGE
jgi:hypothetical protein